VGEHTVYESSAQCLAVCAALEAGTIGQDGPNDTIGCRKTHSYNALVGAPATHCPHSGPGGASVCGTDCPAYCRLLQAACPTEFASAHPGGAVACTASCMTERGGAHVDYDVQSADDPGAGIACRMLYTARAITTPTAGLCQSAIGQGSCAP
jgi:hypothetical protein